MIKKVRIRVFCKICNKPTTHELRTIDDKETYVCLLCARRPRHGNDDFKQLDQLYRNQVVEMERQRIMQQLPPGML